MGWIDTELSTGNPRRQPLMTGGGQNTLARPQGGYSTTDPWLGTSPPQSGSDPSAPAGTVNKGPAWTQGPSAFGNDYRRWFQALTQGMTASSDSLKKLGQILQQYGVKLRPNAAGSYGKIELPTGQVIDVGQAFSSGDPTRMKWQWLEGGGSDAGGAAAGSAVTPWTEGFTPPNVTDDPGYAWRMQQGQQALERSAASRGTLLTGGTLKDLQLYSQGLASQEYGQAYGRKRSEYDLRRDVFESNQDRPWQKLRDLAASGRPT